MLLVPSWGSHRWVLPPSCLWNFPEFPAGLFLADPRRCPLWTSYPTSWFHTKSSHNGLLDSCLWILPLFLDPLLQFSSGISCVVSVLDFSLLFFFPAVIFARVILFANINLVIASNQVIPALSSAPVLICLSSPLLACVANSSSSVRLNQALQSWLPKVSLWPPFQRAEQNISIISYSALWIQQPVWPGDVFWLPHPG